MNDHDLDPVAKDSRTGELEHTIFGNDIADDDELERPPHDRSPLTPGSLENSDR